MVSKFWSINDFMVYVDLLFVRTYIRRFVISLKLELIGWKGTCYKFYKQIYITVQKNRFGKG